MSSMEYYRMEYYRINSNSELQCILERTLEKWEYFCHFRVSALTVSLYSFLGWEIKPALMVFCGF